MADFTGLLNSLVKVANDLTGSLQASVTHRAFANTFTRDGQPQYAAAVTRHAIVDKKQQQVVAADGTQRMSHTRLTFLAPVSIDLRDKLTLPDGTSPAILAIAGPLGSDGRAFVTEVWF